MRLCVILEAWVHFIDRREQEGTGRAWNGIRERASPSCHRIIKWQPPPRNRAGLGGLKQQVVPDRLRSIRANPIRIKDFRLQPAGKIALAAASSSHRLRPLPGPAPRRREGGGWCSPPLTATSRRYSGRRSTRCGRSPAPSRPRWRALRSDTARPQRRCCSSARRRWRSRRRKRW